MPLKSRCSKKVLALLRPISGGAATSIRISQNSRPTVETK